MTKEDWIKEWNVKRFNEFGECVGSVSELFMENQKLREVRKSELKLYRNLEAENKMLIGALKAIKKIVDKPPLSIYAAARIYAECCDALGGKE